MLEASRYSAVKTKMHSLHVHRPFYAATVEGRFKTKFYQQKVTLLTVRCLHWITMKLFVQKQRLKAYLNCAQCSTQRTVQ
ncbi:hypothetical protein OK016_09355 [Vibrio chagasii]|nr:hypothetical protein [Vibrio chagasii]